MIFIKKIQTGLLLVMSMTFISCASMKNSVLTGVGTGAASGALVGSGMNNKDRGKGAAMGALSGALIGGITSYFIHKGLEKRDDQTRRKTLFNLDKFSVSTPGVSASSAYHGLTMPKVESEWVPTRVEGKKLIEGHKIWLITDDAQWIPGSDMKSKSKK